MAYNYKKYLKTYESIIETPGGKEKLTLRPLTTNDMKKLLVYENENDPLIAEKILDDILTDTVTTENYNVDNQYIQDRYFTFIKLREVTKGSIYKFPYTCKNPDCKLQTVQKIDLSKLNVKPMEIKEDKVKLLDNNLTLQMGFFTRGKQKEAYSLIDDNLSATEKQIEMMLADLALMIQSIKTPEGEDKPEIKDMMEFIGDLPQKEYDVLKE
ncbi:MAG: hypothetical protein ACOCZ5_03305 [bacterium]